MTRPSEDFDDPIRTIGHDASSTFDDTASDPTEHASSEAQASATDIDGEADPISGSDDAVEPEGLNVVDYAEDEAPIVGEYLSDPAASTGSTTDLDADALEDDEDKDELDDDEDDLDDDEDADLGDEASPQTSVGEDEPAP